MIETVETVSVLMMCLAMVMGGRRLSRCCCEVAEICGDCGTDETPTTVNVEFEDVADGDCTDCGDLNSTTIVMTQESACLYGYRGSMPCDSHSPFPTCLEYERWFYDIDWAPTNLRNLTLIKNQPFGGECVDAGFQEFVNIEAHDCDADHVATNDLPGNESVCDFTSATVTIKPQAPFV